jgi:hypothetical protein
MRFALIRNLEDPSTVFDTVAIEHTDGTRVFSADRRADAEDNRRRKADAENGDFILDIRGTYRAFLLGDYTQHRDRVDMLIQQKFGYTQEEIARVLK